eukprot:gb/GECG01004321.1/.p1 GENE.gb/GECG01004321.1/~~gb/GECG01004321.1/.p1  ORF type:complete len:775 (+),score=82.01 gb/GECG01004321.1/:1-2325(+)
MKKRSTASHRGSNSSSQRGVHGLYKDNEASRGAAVEQLSEDIVSRLKKSTAEQQLRRFVSQSIFPNDLIKTFIDEEEEANSCGDQSSRFASLLVDVDHESVRNVRWLVGSLANSILLQDANSYSSLSKSRPLTPPPTASSESASSAAEESKDDNDTAALSQSSSQSMLTPQYCFLHDKKGVQLNEPTDFFRKGALQDNSFVGVDSIMHCTSICKHSNIVFSVFSPEGRGEKMDCYQRARMEWDRLLLDRMRILHLDLNIPAVKARRLIRRNGILSYHFAPLSEASKFVLYTDDELLNIIQGKNKAMSKPRSLISNDRYKEFRKIEAVFHTASVSELHQLFRELHPYNRTHIGVHDSLHKYVGSFSDFAPLTHLVSQFADTASLSKQRSSSPESKGERKPSRAESSSSVFHGYSLWHCGDGTMLRTPPTAAYLEPQWISEGNPSGEDPSLRADGGSHSKESANALIRFSKLTEYIHIKTFDSILQQGKRSYLVAQQMSKQGIPDHQRRKVWSVLLKTPRTRFHSAKGRYHTLLDDVFSLEYMVDDLVRADVSGCCEDDSWFPFERLISNVLMAWTRDPGLLADCTDTPHSPIRAHPQAMKGVSLQVPPSGVLPFEQLSTLAAPLCYVTRDEAQLYELWRAMYTKFWCRLSSISGKEDSLPFLCRQFEELCFEICPGLYMQLVRKGMHPLQLVFPLLRTAFAGCLDVRQVLLLWDRIIAFNSLKLLPVCGVALLLYRGHELLQSENMDEARYVYCHATGNRRRFTYVNICRIQRAC